VDLIYLDFSKAFKTVSSSILVDIGQHMHWTARLPDGRNIVWTVDLQQQ